ncbi:MAG: SLC13 family permease [Dehalococcoidales bacterium]|nr:SLC13 family permease [Dehalococcoidales bacterium]
MNADIAVVLIILVVTAVLLIIDKLRIDVVGLLCLLALAWTGVLEPLEALSGFSSNAVITMIAVMILGKGISHTGVMSVLAREVVKHTGSRHSRIVAVFSSVIGLLSGFVQNIGAAVLFLPAILNISRRQKIPASSLIMPIGFAIIVGGPLTMIGSGPMILANDFLGKSSLGLYGFFAVTPIGLSLLAVVIVYFLVLGNRVLPKYELKNDDSLIQTKLAEEWHLSSNIRHYRIESGSPIIGMTLEETGIWDDFNLNILAISREHSFDYAPWRETKFEVNQVIALLGNENDMAGFAGRFRLVPVAKPAKLAVLDDSANAGFAEVLVPPRSSLIGQTIRKFGLRRHYGVEPLLLYHKGGNVRGDISDIEIDQGDIFIVHGLWSKIADMKKGYDFLVVTNVEPEEKDSSKAWIALVIFLLSVGLAIAGFSVPVVFMSGAVLMVLTRVIRIDDAYRAVDWKVVFFIAGLIPLGVAMQKTGTAAYLADNLMSLVQGSHTFVILLAISLITILFSVFMSNVAAAVILFPMVTGIAAVSGLDPRPLTLLVAVSTAVSFILPTHQVNALYKTPGGYSNRDYIRAGSGLTIVATLVLVSLIYFVYL